MEGSELALALGTLLLVGFMTLLGYLLNRRSNAARSTKNDCSVPETSSAVDTIEVNEQSTVGGSKRQAKHKKRRDVQQEFVHSWLIGSFKGHSAPILDMNFSANGKYLASCAEDRTVLIWCTKELSSKERKSLRVNIEYDHATMVRWSPDGKAFIIHKAVAGVVEVYKVAKKPDGTLASATRALEFPKRHQDDVVGLDIACNGRFILTCGRLNDLVIWDLKGQLLASVDTYLGSTHRARISPCGRFVAASGFTPDVKVWEVAFTKTGEFKQVGKAFDLPGHSSGVYDFAFNSDTSRMATVSKDATCRFYHTKVEFEKGQDPRLLSSAHWYGNTPATIALSPNGEIVVIGHGSSISFYSTVNGELDTTIEDVFNGPIKCLSFDSLGEYVLVAGDRHIKIFRNIPGYRSTIETARKKLSQKQTSATKERLEKTIADCVKFLKDMGERCP